MGKRNKIVIVIVLVVFTIGFASIEYFINGHKENEEDQVAFVDSKVGLTTLPDDYIVDETFESHLPLVIIDTGKNTIPDAFKYNFETETWEQLPGVEPFVDGKITVINGSAINRLSDVPETESLMQIRYRGNMSLDFDKRQYKIELLDENHEKRDVDILGMGEDNDWILTISMIDKSLIRNYLAYTIAGEINEYTPDAQYCEVFIKTGDKYEYKGVYFLCESIKKSDNRVALSDYNPKNTVSSFLLRRDRYDDTALLLNNYATKNELTYGYLELKYPNSEVVSEKTLKYIENRISEFEECLYSNDEDKFEKIDQYIDMDSFADYFIINEFFGNYDAGNNSTYIYADTDGILHMGPVWDFDGAFDNFAPSLNGLDELIFQDHPWFDRLMLSEKFISTLNKRYTAYRKDLLSDENIQATIDGLTDYLGYAQKRDWERWDSEYSSRNLDIVKDGDGIEIDRNTQTYEEEIQQIEDYLSLHGQGIEHQLSLIHSADFRDQLSESYPLWMFVFVFAFLCSVIIARRGMR